MPGRVLAQINFQFNIASPSLSLKFIIVSIIYGQDCSLELAIVKNSAMEKTECEIWQEYQKMHPFIFSHGMRKGVVFCGVANVAVLGS